MFNYKNNHTINFIFFVIFIFCLLILKDYGVSQDEYAFRIHGFVTLNYVGNIFLPELTNSFVGEKDIQILDANYQGKSYGAYYSAILGLIEVIFNIEDKYYQFLFRHYINFTIFFSSLIFFYKSLLLITNNKLLSFIGFLILLLTPRIFANSFYNTIDIYFFSIVIFLNYFTIKIFYNWNVKNLIFVSLFTALVIDHRIAGIYFLIQNLFFFIFVLKKKFINKELFLYQLFYLITSLFFVYIFWPYLWSDPLNNFVSAFLEMSRWNYKVYSLLNGIEYISDNLPWFYTFFWITITTPVIYLIFFLSGIFYLSFELKKTFDTKSQNLISNFYFLSIIIGHIFVILIMKPNLYNGWRHFYYLYPSIVIISVYGIKNLLNKNNFLKIITYLVLICNFIILINWKIQNHPNQQVYFNIFADKDIKNKFDMDYWSLSYKEQLMNIIKNERKNKIKIYNLSESKVFYSLFSLKKIDREKFIIVNSPEEADYIITNYYFFDNYKKKVFKKILDFEKFSDIRVDKNVISSVFKN